MRNSEDILNELQEYGVRLPLLTHPVLEMPDDYFESLADQILSEIRVAQFLESLPASTVFAPPPSPYFDSLPGDIVSQVKTEEFLSQLPKQTPFLLDADYFEKFDSNVKNNKDHKKTNRGLRLISTRFSKPAVAASLILILALSFLLMLQKPVYSVEEQLALIPDSEIAEYIAQHQYEFDSHLGLQTIDETEIDLQKLENEIYSEYLKNVSDDELEEYL